MLQSRFRLTADARIRYLLSAAFSIHHHMNVRSASEDCRDRRARVLDDIDAGDQRQGSLPASDAALTVVASSGTSAPLLLDDHISSEYEHPGSSYEHV